MEFVALKLADGTEIPIDRLQVVGIQKGDYLVVKLEHPVTEVVAARIKRSVAEEVPEVAGRVLVTDGGVELEVVRPEEALTG